MLLNGLKCTLKSSPAYQLLIESYSKAQEVVTNKEVLDSVRK